MKSKISFGIKTYLFLMIYVLLCCFIYAFFLHDNKITESIVTVLDENVTDDQIPSAKSVYELSNDKNIKTYCYLSQLGLTAPCSVGDVFNALPLNSTIIISCSTASNSITDIPQDYGILQITKGSDNGKFSIEYNISAVNSIFANKKWIGQLKGSDGSGLTWAAVDVVHQYATGDSNSANIEEYLASLTQEENFDVLFSSNDNTGKIVDLTGIHLFYVEHRIRYGKTMYFTEVAYNPEGGIIAQRSKDWWNKTWSDWEMICTTKVPNIPRTKIPFTDITSYTPEGFENENVYFVKNGICYISIILKCITSKETWTTVATGLPKNEYGGGCNFLTTDSNLETDAQPAVMVSENGDLNVIHGKAGARRGRVFFSYPVKP